MTIRHAGRLALLFTLGALATPAAGQDASFPHEVRTTKFTINDVDASKAFYEGLVGLTEVNRFEAQGLVEPFMGFDTESGRIGLLRFDVKEDVEKSPLPVSVLTVPDLDPVLARFAAANHPVQKFSGEATGGVRIAITRDPSGNGIELVEVAGAPSVAGARLIVDDRPAVEEFFVRVFGVEPGRRIQTDTFDEVFFDFDGGMYVALYEPMGQSSLPKSEQPVVAIESTDFDAVLERVKAGGLRVREFGTGMFLATGPSGNVVEVVRNQAQ
jgi:predicted enzyme related to lactoylglutathione lyase